MSQFTSQQRKLFYFGGILVLLVPIIWLGRPATGARTTGEEPSVEEVSGGKLAQLRQEHQLGESTLGQVDPASATMQLVLLGLRGVATNLLWLDADEQKKTKNWGQLRTTVDSIILLQPHYIKVWRFQGWNLAYNVSAEWDAVADRYYWVKEGCKFLMEGSRRNQKSPELYWDVGGVLGKKIGRSDEWRQFRKYFIVDPDTDRFNDRADPDINPQTIDNYLAAKEWCMLANDVEDGTFDGKKHEQHAEMRMLFRQGPARAQLDYAGVLQREGSFDEMSRVAWQEAFNDWRDKYRNGKPGFGQELFVTTQGNYQIRLEATTNEDFRQLAALNNVDEQTIRHWVDQYQKIANYRYWRTRALSESEPATVDAHRDLYRGRQLFRRGVVNPEFYRANPGVCETWKRLKLSKEQQTVIETLCRSGEPLHRDKLADETKLAGSVLDGALSSLEKKEHLIESFAESELVLLSGLRKFEKLLERYKSLTLEDETIEEGLMALLYLRYIRQLNEKPMLPQDFPLKGLMLREQRRLPSLEREFRRETGL